MPEHSCRPTGSAASPAMVSPATIWSTAASCNFFSCSLGWLSAGTALLPAQRGLPCAELETNVRGRLFYDRASMMKVLGAYSAPRVLRGSFVARYQDGQPFVRMVMAQDLNQGTDLVQPSPRDRQRLTYTPTVDARVVAEWPLPANRTVGLTFDVFNLPNMANGSGGGRGDGPSFRTETAVQPPGRSGWACAEPSDIQSVEALAKAGARPRHRD